MLRVSNLFKQYQGHEGQTVQAVNDVGFNIPQGKLLTLLGPSGCGKTTTLRCIAGLEQPHGGEIQIDDRVVFSHAGRVHVQAHQRDIGMVFQSYAIWPHMNVFENVAFPLRVARRHTQAEIRSKVLSVLERVQLSGYAKREATKLSGGQQQRLALGRALVREPKLLLLDEPLSNLDAKLREHMRFELKRLQRDIGITSLYVTHDQTEALALSNVIAVMKDGRVQQIGTPREIYERPANRFVADFIGLTNFVPGEVAKRDPEASDGCHVVTEFGSIRCETGSPGERSSKVLISVRPEHTLISGDRPAVTDNLFRGRVVNWVFLGDVIDFMVRIGTQELRVRAHPDAELHRNSEVWVHLPPHRCVVVDLEEKDAPIATPSGRPLEPVAEPA